MPFTPDEIRTALSAETQPINDSGCRRNKRSYVSTADAVIADTLAGRVAPPPSRTPKGKPESKSWIGKRIDELKARGEFHRETESSEGARSASRKGAGRRFGGDLPHKS